MRLCDSEEEADFRARLRDWLRTHAPSASPGAPRALAIKELRAWSKSLHEAGYAGLTWPVQHGGRGLLPAYQAVYAEESELANAPNHVNVIGLNMVGPTIIRHGTNQQRATHLPNILSGDTVFCQGFSEPDAGSDLAAVRTRARRVQGGFLLDGEKVWSSYAHIADHCLLLARTNQEASKHRGLTCFLLDMRASGVEVRPLRQMSGDTDFNQIILRDVAVVEDSVLGPLGDGWRVALSTLAHERGTFGVTLAARLAVEFDRLVQTVTAVGAADDPVLRRDIADLYVQLQGLRFTGHRVLAALERTSEPGPESAILKLRWSQADQRLCALALRVLAGQAAYDGPDAFWAGYWQRRQLRSRATSIEGGTSEILRSLLAERVLGLPRSR